MRKSEVIKTSKSYQEIIASVANNTEGERAWRTNYDPTKPFYRKIDGNLIYLNSLTFTYWPVIELELNEFTEPKVSIHYSGFRVFLVFYCILFILFLAEAFELETWNQILVFSAISLLFILAPFYITFMQRNFKNWLTGILEEK